MDMFADFGKSTKSFLEDDVVQSESPLAGDFEQQISHGFVKVALEGERTSEVAEKVSEGVVTPTATVAPDVEPASAPTAAPAIMGSKPVVYPTEAIKQANALDRAMRGLGSKSTLDSVAESAFFTAVDIQEEEVRSFAREYTTISTMKTCLADKEMLLHYMFETERKFNVTLSFLAYGVDPIVFDEHAAEEPKGYVSLTTTGVNGEEHTAAYEKILIDGMLYFSCLTESLNPDYLYQVISEATEAVLVHDHYIYTLVGPRPLNAAEGHQGEFIETLKLNSYELSVLLSHMKNVEGVQIIHGMFDGCSAIMFQRSA